MIADTFVVSKPCCHSKTRSQIDAGGTDSLVVEAAVRQISGYFAVRCEFVCDCNLPSANHCFRSNQLIKGSLVQIAKREGGLFQSCAVIVRLLGDLCGFVVTNLGRQCSDQH